MSKTPKIPSYLNVNNHLSHTEIILSVFKSNILEENKTSWLIKPMSITLCRQQVTSHHAFCRCSRGKASVPDCAIWHIFLTYVNMTSEQVGPHLDTFLTEMHLLVITGIGFEPILLISNEPSDSNESNK